MKKLKIATYRKDLLSHNTTTYLQPIIFNERKLRFYLRKLEKKCPQAVV